MSINGSLQDFEVQKFVESPTRSGKAIPEVQIGASALPSGAATEATLLDVKAALVSLEGYTDGLESLLSFINSNTDGLEGFVDGLETLITTSNTLLTTINSNVDNLEAYTDGLETLITSTNTMLTSISGYVDGLEGYTDGIEGLLTTIRDNADQLEGYLDGVEASLSSIDGKITTTNSTLSTISSIVSTSANQTTANSSLSSIDTKLSSQATAANQSTGNTSLSSIDGKITTTANGVKIDVIASALPAGASTSALQTTANTSLASIDTKLSTSNTSLASIDAGVPAALGQTTMSASMPVTLSSDQTGINTFLDKTASGSLTALNDAVTISTNGCGTVGIQITGTWVGRLQFQGTNDGSTYFSVSMLPRAGTAAIATSGSGNTQGEIPCAGLIQVRILRDIATSGTAVVTMSAGNGTASVYAYSANANNFLAGVSQVGTWTTGRTWTVAQATDSVTSYPIRGALTDASGTTNASSTQVLASNASRQYLAIYNNETTAGRYVAFNFTSAAVISAAGSITLGPGESHFYEGKFIPTEALNIIGLAAGYSFTVKAG